MSGFGVGIMRGLQLRWVNLVKMIIEVTGKKLNYEVDSKREGDSAVVVASNLAII